jgi:hypothetical protein
VPFFLLLAAAQMAPPAEPLGGELRGAIWADLRLNGVIGNGEKVAWRWMNFLGSARDAPLLHILDLACRGNARVQRCAFELLRDGGTVVAFGYAVPDRIRCRATLRRSRGGAREWSVPHLPPGPHGGHSRTTLRCNWVGRSPERLPGAVGSD